MTGTVFTIINISDAGVESNGSALPAVRPKNISTSTQAVKIAKPIPGRRMLYIRMGDSGPTLKCNARLYTADIPGHSDEVTAWSTNGLTGVFANTLLKVTSAELPELPANSYWWVDAKTLSREGGWFAIYNMELVLTRSFFDVTDAVRST